MPTFGSSQLKLLEKLCNVIAVSGDEGEVRKIVLEAVKPYADEVKVDALGKGQPCSMPISCGVRTEPIGPG